MKKLVIACKTVEGELQQILPGCIEIKGLEQGLHRDPDHLRHTLQAEIDSSEAATILLAYGLCGNGVVGLRSRTATLIVPRVDDCIAVLLGSKERYREELGRAPGTYWLSHGWIQHSQDPYKEYQRVKEKYDEETARWVSRQIMKGYTRVVLIETSACPPSEIRSYAQQFARFFGLEYHETRGTDHILCAMLGSSYDPRWFVVVGPGETITAEMFLTPATMPNG